MERISTLRELTLRGSKYILILASELSQHDDLQLKLDQCAQKFGDEIGLPGRLVRATTESARHDHISDLIKKSWPDPVLQRISHEEQPFLVIIHSDFDRFDPTCDDWRIIWLGEARRPRNAIPRFFAFSTRVIRREEDLFDCLDRKITNDLGITEFGGIASLLRPESEVVVPRRGRPGVFFPEFGACEAIDRLIQATHEPRPPKWRMAFAKQLRATTPALHHFTTKGVYNAMKDEDGLFEEIERNLDERNSR